MNRSSLAVLALSALVFTASPRLAQAQVLDRPEGGQHVVVVGNTLWDLAAHFYGDPFQWPRIYEANVDRIDDPHWIYPGQIFRIPDGEGNFTEVRVVAAPGAERSPGEPAATAVTYAEPERTKFWRDTAEVARAAEAALAQWLAVPQSIFYSAPFLDFENGRGAAGRIVGFEGEEEIRSPRSGTVMYDRVVLELDAGMLAPGTRLQVFNLAPARETLPGLVATPTGVVTVLHRSGDAVVARVEAQYDRMLLGDLIRPLPAYPGEPGVLPEPVEGGPVGAVLGYAQEHELHQPGNFLFLDMGRGDGLEIGDEFIVEYREPAALVEGRAQVVGLQDEVATARIVMMRNPVFLPGIDMRLDRKMPAR